MFYLDCRLQEIVFTIYNSSTCKMISQGYNLEILKLFELLLVNVYTLERAISYGQ